MHVCVCVGACARARVCVRVCAAFVCACMYTCVCVHCTGMIVTESVRVPVNIGCFFRKCIRASES